MPATRADWKGAPTCGGDPDLPVVDGIAFDRQAATDSVFAWAGGDDFDPAKARRAFVLYDDGAPELRGSYHLPFARYNNGRLEAVGNGVRNAKSRVEQYEPPLPTAIHDKAVNFLDGYMAKLHDMAGDDAVTSEGGNDGRVQVGGMRVPILGGPAAAARVVSPEDMAAIVGRQAFDPQVFGLHPPFTFPAIISSDLLDSYYTHMSDRTLRNYAADAEAGVSVQNSHRDDELPLGRSFRGEYFTDLAGNGDGPDAGASITAGRSLSLRALFPNGPLTTGDPMDSPAGPRATIPGANSLVIADAYIMPGIKLNEVASDDLILGIRSGMVNDVSVGFYGGTFFCDICGRDLWDWDCPHIPGMTYQAREDGGKYSGSRVATASVEDAHLAEFSMVYKGASPGAAVIKGRMLGDAGLLPEKAARLLTRRYQVRFRGRPFQVAVPAGVTERRAAPDDRGEERATMPTMEELEAAARAAQAARDQAVQERDVASAAAATHSAALAANATTLGRVRQLLREAGITAPDDADPSESVRAVIGELQAARPLAETGRAYRTDLINDAVAQGVRAFGTAFQPDTMRTMLERSTLDEIKHLRKLWGDQADAVFGPGRVTVEDEQQQQGTGRRRRPIPDSAFRA